MTDEARQHRFTLPKGAADLLLIRHGETEAAIRGQNFPMKDGQGDPSLHPVGRQQAEAIGKHLADWPIDAIWVTSLIRTHQTAAPLTKALNLTPQIEPDLREIFLGDWDGGEYRFRANELDPAYVRARDTQQWGEIPGAETTQALHARVKRGLLNIAAQHPDQLVAVFVHGGVVAAAMSVATGAQPFALHGAANGSISRIVIHGNRMIVREFNNTSHLTSIDG